MHVTCVDDVSAYVIILMIFISTCLFASLVAFYYLNYLVLGCICTIRRVAMRPNKRTVESLCRVQKLLIPLVSLLFGV